MSDVPDETENEIILAFRSKDEAQIERVQKAAENIAERMFKDALDLLSPFRTFDAKKRKTPGETPLERATIAKQYHLTDAFNHFWSKSKFVNHAEKVRAESVDRDQGFENFKKEVFSIFKMRAKVADLAFLARENAKEPEKGIQVETIVEDKNPKLQIFKGVFSEKLGDAETGITVEALRLKAAQVKSLGENYGVKTEVFQTSNIPPTKKRQKKKREAIGRQSVPLHILTKHKLNNPNSKNEDIKAESYLMQNLFDYTRYRLSRKHIPADAKFSTDGFVCLLSQKNQEIQGFHSDYRKHIEDTCARSIPADDSDSQKSLLIATQNNTLFWYLTETVPDILDLNKSAEITKIKDGKDTLKAKAVTMMAGDVLIFDRDLLHAGDKYRDDRASETESEAARFFVYFGVGGHSKTPRVHGATAKEKTQGVSSFTAAPFFLPVPDVPNEGDEGVKIVCDESSLESFNESVQRSGALRKGKRKT